MDDESASSTPPELGTLLDLELNIEGAKSPVDQQHLQAALQNEAGVKSVSFLEEKTAIEYDPQSITKARLIQVIGAAGYSVSESNSAPPVPPVDSAVQ